MHRAEQILQAAATAIEAMTDIGAAVFKHRTLSLSAEDQELPAVCVNTGADNPIAEGGYTNLAFIDSRLELKISIYAQGSTQEDVDAELVRLRVVTHKALLASPRDLGLPDIVQTIGYGGAEEPEYSTEGAPLAGRLNAMFTVDYRMSLTDPE